ncbi:hypothetical protein I3843_15G085900 [Carya illinoinensis]|nr:hypothetical protein I3843_15G085900 [Carya illinoinensis]
MAFASWLCARVRHAGLAGRTMAWSWLACRACCGHAHGHAGWPVHGLLVDHGSQAVRADGPTDGLAGCPAHGLRAARGWPMRGVLMLVQRMGCMLCMWLAGSPALWGALGVPWSRPWHACGLLQGCSALSMGVSWLQP